MFLDDLTLLGVSVAFGAWLGWAMSRRPSELTPAVVSLLVALAVGVGTWIVAGGDPATRGGQAAIALTVGATTALLAVYLKTRRAGVPR